MNTTKIEIKIRKLNLQPGEVLLVTLPEVTRRFSDELGQSIRKIVGPAQRVVFMREGIGMEPLTEEGALELVRACPKMIRRALALHEAELVRKGGGNLARGENLASGRILKHGYHP